MQSPLIEAVASMTEVMKEEIIDTRIALEIIALVRSFFKDNTWELTVKIVKSQNEEVLFFSSLSEDEARFWRYPVDMVKHMDRPGIEGNIKKEIYNMENLKGLWIIEDQNQKISSLTKEEESILDIAALLCHTCILAEDARYNLERDWLTGFMGKTAFGRNLERQKEKNAYLVAVRNANAVCDTDLHLLRLAEICKEMQPTEIFRIDSGILAFFPENKEDAFSDVQKLMELVPEVAVYVTPAKQIDTVNALKSIVSQLVRTKEGKISDSHWTQKTFPIEIFKERG